MRCNSVHGLTRRVVYLDENGRDLDLVCARAAGLVKGQEYEVAAIEVGSWNTGLWLKGFPGKEFNSVMFGDAEADSEG